ncbi:translation initiation inhibitor [Mycolicibacterium mageritense DSM 44476 = CIP 104973]|uniref:Translation initiation inhibitor n=1 Tax=Mycolicibacterium mageritense TaxID=53462 RepID=A0ABN5YDE4_MYCME|nr:RidA family protein [Mycolicibacterium mageritense]MBN3453549.1 RidA family protein [Mycobacterium sp. DSM 3803]MCC9185502.1 RidA family protein [Mycolicibacterium mageritense]TXI61195.1 MAG: RidA family protein [Mycolicibacterium mageritense]CDO24274.1 translation initiation inhibitor [Mycolicibacterium mageritense DSM 44476 = CIP 104973]BBX36159.1 translation initiation inhibitor [Mycolicibacterium mageritense]
MSPRDRLAALGFEIPPAPKPKGAYFPSRRCGDQLWISGSTARRPGDPGAVGVVGDDVTVEQARIQARFAALNLIAAIDAAVGVHAVTALVHLRGYVRARSDFDGHPAVIDGASELLIDVFGEDCGAHARTAIGVASLPGGACVELELVASVG